MLILEAGINHFGKSKEAEKFLDFFLSSKFTHLSFMIQTTQFYKNFENKINFKLTNSFYKKAILLAHKKKKKIGLAVCDPISFGEVSNINFDFYKLLSISINDKLLINALNNKIIWDYNASKQLEIFNAEINQLMEILSKNLRNKKTKKFIKETKILFKETSGLGLNNLLFIKK